MNFFFKIFTSLARLFLICAVPIAWAQKDIKWKSSLGDAFNNSRKSGKLVLNIRATYHDNKGPEYSYLPYYNLFSKQLSPLVKDKVILACMNPHSWKDTVTMLNFNVDVYSHRGEPLGSLPMHDRQQLSEHLKLFHDINDALFAASQTQGEEKMGHLMNADHCLSGLRTHPSVEGRTVLDNIRYDISRYSQTPRMQKIKHIWQLRDFQYELASKGENAAAMLETVEAQIHRAYKENKDTMLQIKMLLLCHQANSVEDILKAKAVGQEAIHCWNEEFRDVAKKMFEPQFAAPEKLLEDIKFRRIQKRRPICDPDTSFTQRYKQYLDDNATGSDKSTGEESD